MRSGVLRTGWSSRRVGHADRGAAHLARAGEVVDDDLGATEMIDRASRPRSEFHTRIDSSTRRLPSASWSICTLIMWSSNCIGSQSCRSRSRPRAAHLMPGGSGSPTGRTPHDRSRRPSSVGGDVEGAPGGGDGAFPHADLRVAGDVLDDPAVATDERARFLERVDGAGEGEVGVMPHSLSSQPTRSVRRPSSTSTGVARRWCRAGRRRARGERARCAARCRSTR